MRSFRSFTLVFLCLLAAVWPIAIAGAQQDTATETGQRADLYLWLSDRGQTYLGFRSDTDRSDQEALQHALEKAVGGPVTPIAPDDRRFRAPEGDWRLVADFSRALHRRGGLLQGQLDPTPLMPLLHRQGVEWLTINVIQQDVPYSAISGARILPSNSERYVYGYCYFRTDRVAGRPIRFSYGYERRDVLHLVIPMAVVLLLPVGLTLWMRGRALRTEASVDPAVVWFGYGRFLQWLALSPWIVWVPTLLVLHAGDFFSFLLGGTWLAHTGLTYAFWYLPSVVIVWCFSLSHPVFARVRGLDYTRRDLVRQAAWGQARILPLLCLLMGITEMTENPQVGVLWLAAALFTRILAVQGAAKAMGMSPRSLTVGELRDRVFALAAKAGVRVQQVYIMPAGKGRMANAFAAVGNNVILTDFLLERMSRREVDAIIAHELTHLRRRHPVLLTLLYLPIWVGAGALVALIETKTSASFAAGGAYAAAVLLGLLLVYFVSRRFEYAADAGALALTDDPRACILGLTKLSRLNLMPLEWGKHHARWLTHPTTMRRVEAIAHRGGVTASELRDLMAGAHADAEDDCYPLPTGQDDRAVFTTSEKIAYRQRLFWLTIAIATLTPALIAVGVKAAHLSGLAAWAVEGLGLVITILLSHTLAGWVQGRWFENLERRLRAKMASRRFSRDEESVFVTLAPAGLPRIYEGFFDWDIGLLFLGDGRLRFSGEQIQFSLATGAVFSIEVRADTPMWRPWPRVYVTWQGAETKHTFSLRPGTGGTQRQAELATAALAAHLRAWRETDSETPDSQEDGPPPTEDAVTSIDPRAAANPRAFLGSLLFQGAIASGVSILCGLGFEKGTGSAWYVIAVAGMLTVLGFVPFWRRRVQSK